MNYKILIIALMIVVMSPAVVALGWSQDPYWLPVGTSNPHAVDFGGSAKAASGAFTSGYALVHMRAELRTTGGQLVKVLAEKDVDMSHSGYEVVTITKDDYKESGNYRVFFILKDGYGTRTKYLDFVVRAAPTQPNNPPTITCPGAKSVDEGKPLTFYVSGSDPDTGDTVEFSASNKPTGATFDASQKKFSWTPTESQGRTAPYTVTFTATDNHDAKDSCTVDITVKDMNTCPVFDPLADVWDFVAGEPLTITVSAQDAEDDTIIYVADGTPLQHGASFDSNTGTFTWTPNENQLGDYEVLFLATDERGGCWPGAKKVTINVLPRNKPVATLIAAPSTGPEGTTVTFVCSVAGGDSPVSYEIDFDDNSQKANQPTITHKYEKAAVYTASCTVKDADGDTATATAQVTITDNAPVVTLVATPDKGSAPLEVDFDCQVAGGNTPLKSLVINFGDGSSSTQSKIKHTYTSKGVYAASCSVIDADDDPATGFATVDVAEPVPDNNCPVLDPVGDKTVEVGKELKFTLTASDADGDDIVYLATAPLGQFLTADGKFTWTPLPVQLGKHTATFYADDGTCSDQETVTIEVLPETPECSDGVDNDGDGKVDLQDPGCSDGNDNNETDPVTNKAPVADFTWSPADPEVGVTVTFTSTSTDPDGDSLTCAWDLDADGFTDSTDCVTTYVFTAPGDHPVKLTVSDSDLTDSVTKTVTVTGKLNVTDVDCFSPAL
jgi:PKD repeat protein